MSDQQNNGSNPSGGKTPEADKRHVNLDSSFHRTGDSNQAILNNEIEILHGQRLPHLDQGPVLAYAARMRSDSAGSMGYFALICEDHLMPRPALAGRFAAIVNSALTRLVASGVCFWPPSNSEHYTFVYENNLGHPIMKAGEQALAWKTEQAMNIVIRPLGNVLLDLRDKDLYHGNIRPANMFDGGAKVVERIILGDCLATPPSFNQPVLYEPIERGQAMPIARGRGTIEDDIYSFGASLAVILRQKNPLEGMSDDQIIKTKIEIGSYGALVGNDRFTGPVLELLRGLLHDDRTLRWSLDEMMNWLDGQRLSPRQPVRKIKAARPLQFLDEKYFRTQILAMDLYKNQAEAVNLVENGTLDQWLERSLEDKAATARLEQAVASAQETGRGPGYWDRLLARVSIALDLNAPLRFRSLNLTPDGIPAAMIEAAISKKDVQPYLDIINQQLIMYWVTLQNDAQIDIGSLINRFDNSRAYLRQQGLGYGLERCLYFLCPEAPCLSDVVKGYYVRGPEDLIYALEDISRKPNRPHLFIDRHIAAFLSVKDRKSIDPYMIDLNSTEFHRRVMGNILVLAGIQKHAKMEGMPGLAAWAAEVLKPLYERYHDRELRVKIKQKVDKLTATGNLSAMAYALEDYDAREKDMTGFKFAMQQYNELRQELSNLEQDLEKPDNFGREVGHQYAAVASGLIGSILIMTIAFLYFTNSGIFKNLF